MTSLTDHQNKNMLLGAEWYEVAQRLKDFESYNYLDEQHTPQLAPGQDFFFGGFAGTGKSTILPHMIEKFGLDATDVSFCAPTGKAAKVMGNKLKAEGIFIRPTTIHKLIYLPKSGTADAVAKEIDQLCKHIDYIASKGVNGQKHFDRKYHDLSMDDLRTALNRLEIDMARLLSADDGPKFRLKDRLDFPPQTKLIVVDEASMCGGLVANDLAYFGVPILAIGDPGQLPPVKDTHGFNVKHPDAFLTEIHRQAKDNPIIYLATRAREGKDLKVGDYGDGVEVVARRDDTATLDLDRDAILLVGTHRKKWQVTEKIREGLGYTDSGPYAGEPLMVCKNSTKIPAMVNGTIVECMTDWGDLQRGNDIMTIRVKDVEDDSDVYPEHLMVCAQSLFEEHVLRQRGAYTAKPNKAFDAKRRREHLDWAHALTVHKAQGSQWDDVVLHDESGVFRQDAAKWLYTGVTRAAKRLTVIV